MEYKFSDIFSGIGVKRLSSVEVDRNASNQHEFNGVNQFKSIFGESRLENIPTQFIYISDDDQDYLEESGLMTWYDARLNHPTRSEYRLYFTDNKIIQNSRPDDLLVIARRIDKPSLLVIVAAQGTTIENQLIWFFGFGAAADLDKFFVIKPETVNIDLLDFTSDLILDKLGIEYYKPEETLSFQLMDKYQNGFPDTRTFSEEIFIWLKTNNLIDLIESPDDGIIKLLQVDENCFKTIEREMVRKKIDSGFDSVDDFISYSLSIQNRRKSRAGYAFENHLEILFRTNSIRFSRGKITENKSKPDFIFPGIEDYLNQKFDSLNLSMLGVKTTCKDRWRQILSEADRISVKHLATIEPSISQNQTDEMENRNVKLVLPFAIHKTFNSKQQNIILSIKDFINYLKKNN